MKFLLVILLTAFTTATFAQETTTFNDPNAKTRSLNGTFSAISVTDGIELYLTQGSQESIAVSSSDEKYDERFKTIVENGLLKIYYDNNGINWSDNNKRKLKAYVSFIKLDNLTGAGGADVNVASPFKVDDLNINFSSGANFNGQIEGKDITVEQSSGSIMNISGKAAKFTIGASSGATFKGYDFAAEYCEAKATSGASIRISVQKELSARANSGGGIHYKGSAVIKDIDISSGGTVKKI
ncbi:MAG: head GIN domain-containing protein [Ferruginibacter sp.]